VRLRHHSDEILMAIVVVFGCAIGIAFAFLFLGMKLSQAFFGLL
jgi:hypothetical protein